MKDILGSIDLRRLYPELYGNPVMVPCPKHKDKSRPNLAVYKNNVYCFTPSCGFHEGAFAYVARVKGLRDMHAILKEAEKLCVGGKREPVAEEPPLPLDKSVAREYARRLQAREDKVLWLHDKYGLTPDTMYKAGIGYTGARPYAYTLPVFALDGSLVNIRFRVDSVAEEKPNVKYWGIRGRNSAVFYLPPPMHRTGVPTIAGALQKVWETNQVVLTEGEYDALALAQVGIPAISATNGAQSLVGAYQFLLEELRGCRVAVAYDRDEVGVAKGLEVQLALRDIGIEAERMEWLLEDGKDCSELVAKGWTADDFRGQLIFGNMPTVLKLGA